MRSKIAQARQLRKHQTAAEKILWSKLRNRQLGGYKFRRQQGIGNYIVDFYCVETNLIVELDGGVHGYETRRAKDETRETFLKNRNFEIARYTNQDICANLDGVLGDLLARCKKLRDAN